MASSAGVFGGGGAFLDGDAKDALVENQTPFAITDVDVDADSQFGPQVVYTIVIDGEDDEVLLAFSHDDGGNRRKEAVRVSKALAVGDGTLEPVYLHSVTTKSGQDARALRGEPMETAPAKAKPAAASKRGAKPAAAAADDDIPF